MSIYNSCAMNNKEQKTNHRSTIPTKDLFIAASYAHRINKGEYVKPNSIECSEGKISNSKLMETYLTENTTHEKSDIELAEKVIMYFQGLTFKILSGKTLNDYERKAVHIASSETTTDGNIRLIASLPSSYERVEKQKNINDTIANCTKEYLDKVGVNVIVIGEVVKSVFSSQWNTNYITMITKTNHLVFFPFKSCIKIGSILKISGKVKNHSNNYRTHLNYVKVFNIN